MLDLKELIGSLFANREQEGVHNLKSATRMVEQLPENQVLEAVTEIVKALQKMNRNQRIGMKERFRTIAYLDEKTRPLLEHLVDVFFGRKIDDTAPPRHVLLTIVAFLGEMANAYGVCLSTLAQSYRSIDPDQLQLFTLRGMMYCSALTKWSYTRYLPVKQGVWHIINQFYQFAELQRFTTISLSPYTNHPATNVQQEYLLCLMLSLSMPEKMQVGQIELVVQWLRKWEILLDLESEISPNRQAFAINTAVATSPRRLQRDMVGDGWRYINTDKLVQHMQSIISRLQFGDSPASLDLPEESALRLNIQLMQQLLGLWSREIPAPKRRDKRQSVNKPVIVLCGFKTLCEQLASTGTAIKGSPGTVLTLTVENESESGLGAKFMPKRFEQLPVGEVVGLLQEGGVLRLGVVRRLACQPDGKMFGGIEFLTRETTLIKPPMLVGLTPPGKPRLLALYSPDSSPNAKDRFLLLPQADYVDQGEYLVEAQGKSFLIRLSPPIEYTPETVRVGFFVQSKVEA